MSNASMSHNKPTTKTLMVAGFIPEQSSGIENKAPKEL
jgi:hypothetical protein